MILKLVGAAIFISGGFFLGKSIEKTYSEKTEFWHEVVDFFTNCQSRIGYSGATVEDICAWQRNSGGKYASKIADAIQYGTVTEGDTLLKDFSRELKTVDSETQSQVFSLYLKEAEKRGNDAKDKLDKNGKTYRKLLPVLCFGIAVLLW